MGGLELGGGVECGLLVYTTVGEGVRVGCIELDDDSFDLHCGT